MWVRGGKMDPRMNADERRWEEGTKAGKMSGGIEELITDRYYTPPF
jgi:hypothetical protein